MISVNLSPDLSKNIVKNLFFYKPLKSEIGDIIMSKDNTSKDNKDIKHPERKEPSPCNRESWHDK
ncbi:MAG: hypothetical protein WCS88_04510 [Patescibacteria group bacterium]|jgi:hypothetical protein